MILEVPHFAALHGNEREIMVLRSENGQTWREHPDTANEQSIQSALCGSFEGKVIKLLRGDRQTYWGTHFLHYNFHEPLHSYHKEICIGKHSTLCSSMRSST